MLTLNPYLSFNGNCEAAFTFYKSVFGGEFEMIGRYKDIPSDEPMPESEANKIIHISLKLTDSVTLMGADSSELLGRVTKFGCSTCLSICTESEEETLKIYKALSEGGVIEAPLEKTYWVDLYAYFTDKFGICWAINFEKNPQ